MTKYWWTDELEGAKHSLGQMQEALGMVGQLSRAERVWFHPAGVMILSASDAKRFPGIGVLRDDIRQHCRAIAGGVESYLVRLMGSIGDDESLFGHSVSDSEMTGIRHSLRTARWMLASRLKSPDWNWLISLP